MKKKDIRIAYRKKRNELSEEDIEEKSLSIANKLLELPIWNYSFYHIFLSIKHLKEVNTEFILHILNGKDKNAVVSKSDFKSLGMQHYLLTDATPLKANSWGIPEPMFGIEIPPQEIDVIFIPLLAFDKKGERIGYGKGFYDRFLKECKGNSVKVGLSFFEALDKISDIDVNDIGLDYCVTPDKIYTFNQ
ncbi:MULTISPECIES: 5-formyltetrahydrofolate cyclo-ligase [Mesonia]|uniref:5-formyltetrahydrofolate cyclo-ligase n=1 Tax=Mesonia oceanica TaxID=2687242 RepID=A0AC61YBI9_9FLAO|nr:MULTISPECIES: 5-formyltetrahydrofolate cyclo-ligase [Mesonia]MAN28402.1 5-formyltetrahydrofolate cyclo-ligase [Mesonia sp.]MAQ40176.1 5-formyltetrahydrofolate cyclo-ligase [Mesonia sp.]MBJ98897.1 5-formyltetrahydrofolate cyclo-ligase [Flavobacteriaceae bacterium]VVV01867.1 5-formyltetrahydrofolate cyclo-ligase [Mesonia oceanica]|tara:strand:+ start:65238 stop:65807 length:570 start_codon:yes stop_codon:yes gene_type:complete